MIDSAAGEKNIESRLGNSFVYYNLVNKTAIFAPAAPFFRLPRPPGLQAGFLQTPGNPGRLSPNPRESQIGSLQTPGNPKKVGRKKVGNLKNPPKPPGIPRHSRGFSRENTTLVYMLNPSITSQNLLKSENYTV